MPRYHYGRQELSAAGAAWLGEHSPEHEVFNRFLGSACIDHRSFAVPLDRIIALEGAEERTRIFEREGFALGAEVIHKTLSAANTRPSEIETLVFSSCSSPTIPSLETRLITQLELPATTMRVPVYQYGCAGGAAGLSLARQLARVRGKTLLVCVELCSLVFQREHLARGNLVGSVLFGDGAAAALLEPAEDPGWFVRATQSYLLPESADLMGYDIKDSGTHLRLLPELPGRLAKEVPDLIDDFLTRHAIDKNAVGGWLVHPGGVKILDTLAGLLAIPPEKIRWSYESLAVHGNMSSASLLFVLEAFLADRSVDSQYAVMLGIGPGLTIELLLLERR